MVNLTTMNEFFLSGLSDNPALQLPLFLVFLLIYLLTITWNLLIIVLIFSDRHLQTPMYFFLGNLASLDLCYSSVTAPRMLFDLHNHKHIISKIACTTQIFFFIFFAISEVFLLAVMSYDRYTAVCQPLHYTQIMQLKVCVRFISGVWFLSFTYSSIHTIYAFKLTFCRSYIVESFFCDLPQLLQIACNDIYVNILLLFILGSIFGLGSLILTILSYVSIFKTVFKLQAKGTRGKVFSTCTSHLTVVLLFYCSVMFNYFQPSASHSFHSDKGVAIFYTVILPLLNPLIYSLRNQDFKTAINRSFHQNRR